MVKRLTFLPLVLATFLSLSVSAIHSRPRTAHNGLVKRIAGELSFLTTDLGLFTGTKWTFFDAGLGACGVTSKNEDFIVALNAIQFGDDGDGYPSPKCFKTITMEYNSKRAMATIVDMCPECPYGALDLSRGLFDFFAPEDEGVIYGQWYFGEDSRREGNERENPPPPPTKTTPTHPKVHATPLDPVEKLPGIAHPNHASEATPLSRPLNHSGKQLEPASEKNPHHRPSPLRIPSASNATSDERPNGRISTGSELSSNQPTVSKPATSNVASILKGTPPKSEFVSDGESEQPESLAALNKSFGRLGSMGAGDDE